VIDPKKDGDRRQGGQQSSAPGGGGVDTNCDPDRIDLQDPGQRRRDPRIRLFCAAVAEAVIEGRNPTRSGKRGAGHEGAGDGAGGGAQALTTWSGRGALGTMALDEVRELREKTGAGLLDCQKALGGRRPTVEKRSASSASAASPRRPAKATRAATDGAIGAYIHPPARSAVLIEVNSRPTSRQDPREFQQLVEGLAMQVAASSPRLREPRGGAGSELEAGRDLPQAGPASPASPRR